jgi:oligopeptide/dipeptide ABC transporter ATP-binding protein
VPLVSVERVTKTFKRGRAATLHAVNDVSLAIEPGETLGLIGESGAGKSTVGRIVLRLHDADSGTVLFDGVDLARLGKRELQRMRSQMTMVFQEPYQSLDPRMRIQRIVEEPLVIHEPSLSRREREARVLETLEHVGLGNGFAGRYPHELSGGQQQRAGVARAIVTRPKFVVLDEPTSSLDLSVRAQVLQLLGTLQREFGLAYLLISHDVRSVEHLSSRLAVMYLGQIVETGPSAEVFQHPQHPYTRALLSAALSTDPEEASPRLELEGEIPSPTDLPPGCFLHGRCPIGDDACARAPVPLREVLPRRKVACIKA